MKGTLYLGALAIILFAASAWAGEVSVDISAGWDSHIRSGHDSYRQAPPAYRQWRSGNFYYHRRSPYYRRRMYSPYYRYRYYPPYSGYRVYTPPTYYYYGYGYYGYSRPYYYRPRSGIRVWVEIGR